MPAHVRHLLPQVRRDLARKMVFVAGPRQVGKTMMARTPFDPPPYSSGDFRSASVPGNIGSSCGMATHGGGAAGKKKDRGLELSILRAG